jgi:hypothetical protein
LFDKVTMDLQNDWVDELSNLHREFSDKNPHPKTYEYPDLEEPPRVKLYNEALNDTGLIPKRL